MRQWAKIQVLKLMIKAVALLLTWGSNLYNIGTSCCLFTIAHMLHAQ